MNKSTGNIGAAGTQDASTPLAYSISDACRVLGVGRSTIYEEMTAGRLKAVKCGKRTIIPAASATEWLAGLPAKAA